MLIEELREKAGGLPLLPGVYIMMDETGAVIYVGKAKQLKNRVTGYFRGEHDSKTEAMVSRVSDFDVIVASSEFEALILENSLIKRHQPKYNIKLRDDKGYPFIRLDEKSEYPRFSIAARIANDGARYFGPFGSRKRTREILDTLLKTEKLPICGKKFPRDIGRDRPCLNYHMGACAGYCRPEANIEEYRKSIREAVMALEGKLEELTAELQEKMLEAANELRFETAAQIRDRLRALDSLLNKQRVVLSAMADMDAVGFFRGAKYCFTVLHYTNGELSGKDYELIDDPLEEDGEVVSALVRQYYSSRGIWPKTLMLPVEIEDKESLERLFSETAGRKVNIEVPKRGDKLRFTQAAALNAKEEHQRATTSAQRSLKTLEWLQKTLNLPSPPERIEAFDVSNTGNYGIVAAMTVFQHGKPLKRDYRKFKIKQISTQDDYHSMAEAVTRRFKRHIGGGEGFSELPDLLLIDGGRQHASVAESALSELDIQLPVFGMVKDERHRTRALIDSRGCETGLTSNPAVFALIGNIQEETHRFAVEYHRSLRSSALGSALDKIKGVGQSRRNELLKSFKSVKNISTASLSELEEVVPKNTARAIFDYFQKSGPNEEEGEE